MKQPSTRPALLLLLLLALLSPLITDIPAHALQCQQECIPDPSPPARPSPGCGSSCIPDPQRPTAVVSGVVRNIRGVPLPNAVVYWPHGLVSTNSNGAYSLVVWTDAPVMITADHSLQAWKSITIENPALLSERVKNFDLPFLVNVVITPDAFNTTQFSSQELTFYVYSTAPFAGSRALIRKPNGGHFQLQRDLEYVDPDGWVRWRGTQTIPSGTPEGRYTVRGCVVEELVSAQCDPALPGVLSQVKTEAYGVDYTAPSPGTVSPATRTNIATLGTLSVTWNEAGTELDPSSFAVELDGQARPITINGATITATPPSNLSVGIHLWSARAADIAGNVRQQLFAFSLSPVNSTAATATLQERVIDIESGATSVTFTAPSVAVGAFEDSLSSSLGAGYTASLQRPMNFGSVSVTFANASGSTSSPVSVPTTTANHALGVIAPHGGELRAVIPAASASLADLVVPVPDGYRNGASTATLNSATVSLGTTIQPAANVALMSHSFSGPVTVTGSIRTCDYGDGATVTCANPGTPSVTVRVPPVSPIPLSVPVSQPYDRDAGFNSAPICDGCSAPLNMSVRGSLIFGCTKWNIADRWRDICTLEEVDPPAPQYNAPGYFAAYLNAWTFKEPTGYTDPIGTTHPTYPTWQQNRVIAASNGDACPDGLRDANHYVKASLSRVVTNTTSGEGSSSPIVAGMFRPHDASGTVPPTISVSLGNDTRPDHQSSELGGPHQTTAVRGYQLVRGTEARAPREGRYHLAINGLGTAAGGLITAPGATTNIWQIEPFTEPPALPTSPTGVNGILTLVSGTELLVAPTVGYSKMFELGFQFVADFHC